MLIFKEKVAAKRNFLYLCSEFNRYEAQSGQSITKIKIMDKEKNTLRSSQEGRVTTSGKGAEEIKKSLLSNPMYNNATEPNQASGLTSSKRSEVEYEETPKGLRRVISLNTEYDTLNSLWSAEKNYYLLYCINYNGEMFNKYVLPLRESRLRKPIPHFKTLTAFLEWVLDTNPKALKELLRDVLLMMSNNDRGLLLPDEGGVADTEQMEKYYKGLSRYMAENVLIIENN